MAERATLLVEGRDDEHVVYALLNVHAVPECFKVIEHGGVDSLLKALPVRLKESDVTRVGIVIDADEDAGRRWQAVVRTLNDVGYDWVPAAPAAGGTIVASGGVALPAVGVWIMPDNTLPGSLENFVQFLVPPGDSLLAHAKRCVAGLPARTQLFPDVRRPKAEIHTWLAWQEEPGTPLGLAVTKKYLDGECEAAGAFIAWIKRLFVSGEPGSP